MNKTETVLLYELALSRIFGVGPRTAKKLVAYCGSVEAVFTEKRTKLMKIPGIGAHLAKSIQFKDALIDAENELKFIIDNKISLLFYLDKRFPKRLSHCYDGPLLLFFMGDVDFNCEKIISIVGTRNATNYGKAICDKIINDLSNYNILVISGLAYGIDTFAHASALKHDMQTVGVLAHGLDMIYPSANKNLAGRMIKNGGLLTEFFSKSQPDRENFPKRNRIIAGLSDATLVIEAGPKGGALITADIANSYDRDVFTIPGRVGDLYSKGCNNLIKSNKAALVESAEDIIYLMGWEKQKQKTKTVQTLLFEFTPDEQKIIDLINTEGDMSVDSLSIKSEISISKVFTILLELEFKGAIICLPGKLYRLNRR